MELRIMLLASSLLFGSIVNAAHIGNVTINKIRVHDNYAFIWTVENINKASCASEGTENIFYLPLDETHASNRIYSTLLSAHAQGKPVNPDCETTCVNIGWLGGNITQCKNMTID